MTKVHVLGVWPLRIPLPWMSTLRAQGAKVAKVFLVPARPLLLHFGFWSCQFFEGVVRLRAAGHQVRDFGLVGL